MIEIVKGDLVESVANYMLSNIAHGVNCQGKMASGIAGQLAKRFPKVKEEYLRKYREEGWKLGDVQVVQIHDTNYWNSYVFNCATQEFYGRDGKQYVSYDAVRECMTKVKRLAEERSVIPTFCRIGCSLGGGDWATVENIMLDVFHDGKAKVYVL